MPDYTSVTRIYSLEPIVGSASDLTSAQLADSFIAAAEAEINAQLARRYTVPVAGTIPLLQTIADDIAVYRVLSRRLFSQDQLKDSTWPAAFKESMDTLEKIASGEVLLVDSSGTVISQRGAIATAATNHDDYLPTFHDGGSWLDQVKDSDKRDDENDDRGL